MSVGSPTAGTWSSSQWRPDNEFETDRLRAAAAIVEEAGRHPGRLAGGAPRRAPAADGDAVAVEDQRAVGVAARPSPRQGLGNRLEMGRIRPTNVFERAGESRMTPPASSISSQVRPRISFLRQPE